MKIKYIRLYLLVFSISMLVFTSCSEDEGLEQDPFVVAFDSLSKNLLDITNDTSIDLVYSETALENGSVVIQMNTKNAIYGQDFTTVPEVLDGAIVIPVSKGEIENTILFQKLNSTLDETAEIEFVITSIAYDNATIQGNTNFKINSSASLGGSLFPETGGPNQDNQVFVDLSSQKTRVVKRDSWDLGFYNGSNFRVTINGAVYMAAKSLDITNIDAVTEADVLSLQEEVAVGTFNPENANYVDAPNGSILETAIHEISETDSENPVYLVNLGYAVGTERPTVGSTAIAGNHRGWKKIRILRSGENYVLQYANLNETTHHELVISKNSNYNFNHFSFNTSALVHVEPEKEKWDIGFTVFTNLQEGAGSYGFSDFVIQNSKANTAAYQVQVDDFNYDDFSITDVDASQFSIDQTSIGSNWRDVFSRTVFPELFYIIKDPNGNIYKLRFLAMTNSDGERGYPEFEYKLLQ